MSRILSRRGLIAGAVGLAVPSVLLAEGASGPEAGPAKPRQIIRRKPAAKPPAAAPKAPPPPPLPPALAGVAPDVAMERLMAGNARHAASVSLRPNADQGTRMSVAAGQHPFASILTCADSRVAPEIIFDQGLGDLFVTRVAGNVVDDAVLASLEYSVLHLGSRLIMVLGHERCDFIEAAIDAFSGRGSPDDADTRFAALAALLAPAIRGAPADGPDRLEAVTALNTTRAAAEIFAGSRMLRERVVRGELKIVAARYDLDSGLVTPARAEG